MGELRSDTQTNLENSIKPPQQSQKVAKNRKKIPIV
jgi:hypothetical protein